MRTRTVAPTLLSLLFTLLHTCSSSPLPVPDPAAVAEPVPAPQVNAICSSSLGQTSCGEICCASDQVCLYLGQCGSAAAAQWNYYTTTYTVTGLVTSVRTSTYSSFVGAAATPNPSVSNAPTTTWSLTYYTSNAVNPSSSAGFAYTYTTGSFTPPTRPTESFNGGVIGGDISGSKIMVPSATGTNTYVVPVATGDLGYAGVVGGGGSHHSLSGAQIGGIVGGILGALFLIALILFCCCLRKGFKGFFGWMNSFGRRREEEHETVIVDHGHGSSGHGAGYAGAAAAGAGAGLLASLWGRRKTTTTTTTTTHHHGATHSGSHGVAYGGHASSGHGASGIVAGGHNGQSGGASHGRGGLAAMMGAAAAGLTSIFITRRTQQHMSEKYTSSDESYSSDYVSETSETGSSSSSSSSSSSGSSSSSSSSSSDGHIHGHGRH